MQPYQPQPQHLHQAHVFPPQFQPTQPPRQPVVSGTSTFIFSGIFLIIAAGCFIYVAITWFSDQSNAILLVADSGNLVKFALFGVLAFFLSYFFLFLSLLSRFYS